jgi:multidrug efflux pump subunit AcrA (membrane-fusion protein)
VPRTAVREQDGRSVVFVVNGNRAERRAVSVGGTSAADAEVTAGVREGEAVVVTPNGLRDGQRVRTKGE